MKDLQATIDATECDAVVIGTPIDLSRVLEISKPHTRVTYDLAEIGEPNIDTVLTEFLDSLG
jgi:predicted GTPase